MNLALDIGNSAIKYAIFKDGEIKVLGRFKEQDLPSTFSFKDELLQLLAQYPILKSAISTVASDAGELLQLMETLKSKEIEVLNVSSNIKLPFKNSYRDRCSLGNDRIALAAGAALSFSSENCLIVSLGTCITFDVKTSDNEYIGGLISPGIRMRAQAMNHFTKNLPLVTTSSKSEFHLALGNTTTDSIYNGIYNGVCQEVTGTVNWFCDQYKDAKVILTGGNSQEIAKNLYIDAVLDETLLLKGLDYLLSFNI